MAIVVLLSMMVLDIVTGTLKAIVNKTLNSSLSREGMVRKTSILLLIMASAIFQPIFNKVTGNTDIMVYSVIAVGFCISEFISIIENVEACGVPVPSFVRDMLSQARKISRKQVGVITIVDNVPQNPTPTHEEEISTDEHK